MDQLVQQLGRDVLTQVTVALLENALELLDANVPGLVRIVAVEDGLPDL